MPCNSDHMAPNRREKELSKVAAILDELETGQLNKGDFDGFHPAVYCKVIDKATADKLVSDLCWKHLLLQ